MRFFDVPSSFQLAGMLHDSSLQFEPIMEEEDIQLSRGNFNLMGTQGTSSQPSQASEGAAGTSQQPASADVTVVRTVTHTVPKVWFPGN